MAAKKKSDNQEIIEHYNSDIKMVNRFYQIKSIVERMKKEGRIK